MAAFPDPEPEPEPEEEAPPPEPVEALKLELPGTPREQLLERRPECGESFDETEQQCEISGGFTELPLHAHCSGGCTTWTYRFEDDVVGTATIVRTIRDADGWFYRRFMGEVETLAEALVERFGDSEHEELATWRDVRRARRGSTVPLDRREWSDGELRIRWEVTGTNAFRPALELTVTALREDEAAAAPEGDDEDRTGGQEGEPAEAEPAD